MLTENIKTKVLICIVKNPSQLALREIEMDSDEVYEVDEKGIYCIKDRNGIRRGLKNQKVIPLRKGDVLPVLKFALTTEKATYRGAVAKHRIHRDRLVRMGGWRVHIDNPPIRLRKKKRGNTANARKAKKR